MLSWINATYYSDWLQDTLPDLFDSEGTDFYLHHYRHFPCWLNGQPLTTKTRQV